MNLLLSQLKERYHKLLTQHQREAREESQIKLMVETCPKLRAELPAFIKKLECDQHIPHIAQCFAADDALDEYTLNIARSITAAKQLLTDLPEIEKAWAKRAKERGTVVVLDTPRVFAPENTSPKEITTLEGVTIAKVLDLVESGQLTAARAIELERATARPRPSLLQQLEIEAAHETTP